ncbi:MAG: alpha-mannosidase [Clostridiales bacterium]|nr:alpha-mannosidase [Clostridiales bacterium]
MKSEIITKLDELNKKVKGPWEKRIIAQLIYGTKLSKVNSNKYDNILETAITYILEQFTLDGFIKKDVTLKAEEMLNNLSSKAKSYTMICASHAHIDMNWMWDYSETVAITLDTFRTMLDLMKEYPAFTFSQSQASVYRIVEKYDNEMLQEIKQRVSEGRFEITASTWVEADKNMPNGESLARHILYTKKYLSKLFGIEKDSLSLDFEPDTFGHNQNIPEILTKGGVKYYYHCRGNDGHNLSKYIAPSGNSIIIYREPLWYNAKIDENIAVHVPEFCQKYNIKKMLKVYGVGDHGGGPTRKDIKQLIAMNSWPIFPSIKFGTYNEFFNSLDAIKEDLPILKGEVNFVFTGCYTTQTRIKLANRISEAKLNEAESLSTISTIFNNGSYPHSEYENAWKKTLFNQFHDILPGSGVVETREYAMGQFQETLAYANTGASNAIRNIASKIDTSNLYLEEQLVNETTSEGAGVGYGLNEFLFPQTERGKGKTRIFHLFNSSQYNKNENIELTIWDWDGDVNKIELIDSEDNNIEHQMIENKKGNYWDHTYITLLIKASVPSYGYNTYVMREKNISDIAIKWPTDPRVHTNEKLVLENTQVSVTFDSISMKITSLLNKKNNIEYVDSNNHAGVFRVIDEDDSKGMTAWIIGRYSNINDIDKNIKITNTHINSNSLIQWIEYEVKFRSSKLKVVISLDINSTKLDYNVECDWQETSKKGQLIPQLNFYMPLGYKCSNYKYDIPFGTISRSDIKMDVPANSFMVAIPDSGSKSLMLMSNCKYGFRGVNNSMALTLIRSSYSPDPYPDNGVHKFKLAIDLVDVNSSYTLIKRAYNYNHPIRFVSGTVHKGTLPLQNSFISLKKGNVIVSSLKMAEENNKIIIRVYETEGYNEEVVFEFKKQPKKSYFVDINEDEIKGNEKVLQNNNSIDFVVPTYSIVTICVEF